MLNVHQGIFIGCVVSNELTLPPLRNCCLKSRKMTRNLSECPFRHEDWNCDVAHRHQHSIALRRRERNPAVVGWIEDQRTADLHISVITVGEIERGIAQQQRHNPDFARGLSGWLDRMLDWYGDRILPVDTATARRRQLSAALGHESATYS